MTIRGVNLPCYACAPNGLPTTLDDFRRAYDDLQQVGGNAVALNPVHYVCLQPNTAMLAPPPKEYGIPWLIWPDVSQTSRHPWPQTPSADLIYAACAEAKSRGLFVMLKPMIDPEPGGWRGFISLGDLRDEWVWAYDGPFLSRYTEIVRDLDLDAYCVGTELLQITKEITTGDWPGWIVTGVGHAYTMTYAANWGWADDAEYNRLKAKDAWDGLNRFGVDAYFPLVAADTPVDDKYEQAVYDGWHHRGIDQDWCPYIDDDLTSLCNGDFSRLWFTEIGYRADSHAAVDPGNDPSDGDYSPEAQIACWRAFRRKWGDKLGAYFAWSWELHLSQDAQDRSHNLRGRTEAAQVALAETI